MCVGIYKYMSTCNLCVYVYIYKFAHVCRITVICYIYNKIDNYQRPPRCQILVDIFARGHETLHSRPCLSCFMEEDCFSEPCYVSLRPTANKRAAEQNWTAVPIPKSRKRHLMIFRESLVSPGPTWSVLGQVLVLEGESWHLGLGK